MTDNEIVKALECCKRAAVRQCEGCPYKERSSCAFELRRDALDLINRQQAEIQMLHKTQQQIRTDLKWYLDTNEENGVVYIPEFTVRKITEVSK